MFRNLTRSPLCLFVVIFLALMFSNVIVLHAETTPPDCTNADCPPPPPDCTNADCPAPPPDCTNADCPEETPTDCCCAGSNMPGTTRVCCCRSANLNTVNCRDSLVLETELPEFHQTIYEVTINGFRPKRCDTLLNKLCNPPVEDVCSWRYGQRVCQKVVKRICAALDEVCQYNFCGPDWFPYDAPVPEKAGCEWWDHIRECPSPQQ